MYIMYMQKALLQSPEKVCLLTDGVQDHSDEYFFKWIQDRKIMVPIDTVGFHCTNKLDIWQMQHAPYIRTYTCM